MQDILDKIKVASARSLSRHVNNALLAAHEQIEAQTSGNVGAKLPAIAEEATATVRRFKRSLYEYFDRLGEEPGTEPDMSPEVADSISLLDPDYIEAKIAMEGMVRKMREKEILGEAEFLDRLGPLFPGIRIGQKNNPLDPKQVGDCFNQAIRPLGLKAHFLLTIYREFNKNVFANFENILSEINRLLTASEELPHSKSETIGNPHHSLDVSDPVPAEQFAATPAEAVQSESDAQQKTVTAEPFAELSTLLKQFQASDAASSLPLSVATGELASEHDDDVYLTLQRALAQLEPDSAVTSSELYEQNIARVQSIVRTGMSETPSKLDRRSCDCLNLVSLFYKSLLEDKTLSEVIRKLLLKTQIPISRAALADFDFFNDDEHPGRVFLDEIARLGIAWTDDDSLTANPDYIKVSTLVNRLGSIEATDRSNLQNLADELLEYSTQEANIETALAKRLQDTSDPDEIQDEVDEFVDQILAEHIIDKNLDPAIRKLLNTHLHNALVKILGNDGPGSKPWKAVMQTIDVMLWSVKQEKQAGDAQRFAKIKDRLMNNVEKAMEFSAASKTKIRRALRQLKQVQEYTFLKAETDTTFRDQASPVAISNHEPSALPPEDPTQKLIDQASVDSWFQFSGTDGKPRRMRMAVSIDAIEKYIFRDGKGASTVELSRNRLANALKSGLALSLGGGPEDETLTHKAIKQLYSQLSI